MKFVALISGGKDSIFNIMLCNAHGHLLECVANIRPEEDKETDSYMYQSVGCSLIDDIAGCLGVPLFQCIKRGASKNIQLEYTPVQDDEVEDMFCLLKSVKEKHPDIQGVSVGAILSRYQTNRVQNVCSRLGLTMLPFLYGKDCRKTLRAMIDCGVDAAIIKSGMIDTGKEILFKPIAEMEERLLFLSEKHGVNVCGEGGEYETITLDCPLYKKKIVVDAFSVVAHSEKLYSSVYYAVPTEWHLEEKDATGIEDIGDRLRSFSSEL
ncbi:MAG: diphthine--ammonia ligase [Amphiamblys sp. WSBS2006]|nr:MAG: diphthine--ammonia ligase [Amphiamblys sp. WSBS2006]